jgi:hypothetical protein
MFGTMATVLDAET